MIFHAIRRAAGALAAALVAALLGACGGQDYSAPQAMPTIASFSATPAAVPMGGGSVVLSWSTADASQLVIDNGVGDVSGSTSKSVNVTAGTTFTLTATNALGSVSAATVVTVAAQPASTIASFTATPATLPLGGGSVTLSWSTADATSLSIDNGVGDVSGLTSKAVTVTANTTFTLTASNAAGMVTKTTAVALASGVSLFFDPVNGNDNNPCTQAAPCRRIGGFVSIAAPGTTFTLADGIYGATSQGTTTLTVPDGVTIQAAHPGAVTLGSMTISVPTGSATFSGVVIGPESASATFCGRLSVGQPDPQAGNPTLTLTGVFSNCADWLWIRGNVKATMTPGALPGGVYTTGGLNVNGSPGNAEWIVLFQKGPELLIQGGVIDGGNTGDALHTVLVMQDAGALTLDGVTLRNWGQTAIDAPEGKLTLRNGTVLDHVGFPGNGGCAITTSTSSSSLVMDHSTLSNVPGVGICAGVNGDLTNPAVITLTQSTITKVALAAIRNFGGGGNIGTLNISADGLSLLDNGVGLYIARPHGAVDIRNSTITGSTSTSAGAGIFFDFDPLATIGTESFKLRTSTVANNVQDGVLLSQFKTGTIDLGSAADPGGNTFTGNGTAGLQVDVDPLSAGTVNAVGNTWNASQQGADAGGHYSVPPAYAPVPKTGPASGVNFKIDNNVSALNL
ncbi:MAG: DUF1565 domain-containing protein [Caldimonas sp.]